MGNLKSLPYTSKINVNKRDEQGQTILIRSLKEKQSKSFIMQLIQAGCDANISDEMGVTPLDLAISLSLNDGACELIKIDANVNAGKEKCGKETPLHKAILNNNVEGACILLYYGANVFITDNKYMTPLKYALSEKSVDIAKILINFYDDSYYTFVPFRYSYYQNYLVYSHCEGFALLRHCCCCKDAELFKFLWSRINFESFIMHQETIIFLFHFLEHSCFPLSEWLECLYLILNVFVKRQFLLNSMHRIHYMYPMFPFNVFLILLKAFRRKNIESTDRLTIINFYLSLGAPAYIEDLEKAHHLFGFGEELEALIYATSYKPVDKLFSIFDFILASEVDANPKILCKIFNFNIFNRYSVSLSDYYIGLFGYFSLSAKLKRKINQKRHRLHQLISEKLSQVPEFPSLLELCRNKVRKCIKQCSKIKYPYHFHDAVKKLDLPELIQDIIRFKTPLY